MKTTKKFHNLFKDLEIGIGAVSKSVGVTQRQIRYWEEKGFIKPIDDDSGVRRYSLGTVFLIAFIKSQLDQGYTLAAAVKHSQDIKIKSSIAQEFLRNTFEQIVITDSDKHYGVIDLGMVEDEGQNKKLEGIVDEQGTHFKLKK